MDHKNEDNALPIAPNMKLLTTSTVFNLLRSLLDNENNLVCDNINTPCTAIEISAVTIITVIIG